MNLKLEDLSQYIVIIIFILVIFKVLGSSTITSLYEVFTGKKKSDEIDLDQMIHKKKNQLNQQSSIFNNDEDKPSPKGKLSNYFGEDKPELLELLKAIEWGDVKHVHAKQSQSLLTDISNTAFLSQVTNYFFYKQIGLAEGNLISQWSLIYDNSILWTNLVNTASELPEQRAILFFKYTDIEVLYKIKEQNIHREVKALLDPKQIESIIFSGKKFENCDTSTIFALYEEKLNIFKSLEPFQPKSQENSKEWAKEILGLDNDENDQVKIKSAYKKLTSQIHPDKFNSLNLNDELVATLNSNLALVNKAYAQLTR